MRSRPTKISIVTPSFSGGGAERVAVNLANFYATQGFEVSLIAVQAHGPCRAEVTDAVQIVDLRVKRLRFAALPLIKALRTIRADSILSVIRSTNVLVGIASFFLATPSLVFREANTLNGLRAPTLHNRLTLVAMRLAYRRANCIIANSQDTARDLLSAHIGNSSKLEIIGNPVLDENYLRLFASVADHPWQSDPTTRLILSVGRLAPQKRHDLTIRAFKKLRAIRPDARLLIIGDGGELNNLRELRDQLDLVEAVAFLPFQRNPYPFYKAADVFVLASDWEGFGNVLVEAMSAGTTIVSTDCPGGPKEILADGRFGYLVPAQDIDALSGAMESALENPFPTKLLEGRARSFSIDAIAQRYREVMFSNVASRK